MDLTRSKEDYARVRRLILDGVNDCEIARRTGIPRPTVRDWRWGRSCDTVRYPGNRRDCLAAHRPESLSVREYVYLLGMYLGDGYIARSHRGVWRLQITSDQRYVGIIDECARAMEAIMPGKRAGRYQRKSACVDVAMYSKHWPCLLPQHGPGRKHHRLIRLEPWQEALVDEAHESYVRGLIHSDGCRVIANDRGVKSIRYHFSNRSDDIKGLFCRSLDALGITWTRPDDRGIAVYRKVAVARLDDFIGPKY